MTTLPSDFWPASPAPSLAEPGFDGMLNRGNTICRRSLRERTKTIIKAMEFPID